MAVWPVPAAGDRSCSALVTALPSNIEYGNDCAADADIGCRIDGGSDRSNDFDGARCDECKLCVYVTRGDGANAVVSDRPNQHSNHGSVGCLGEFAGVVVISSVVFAVTAA